MRNNMHNELQYEAPHLKAYGSVEELTGGLVDGDFTDDSFPTNTPKPDLTFS
jgi:hypothetical protein